MIWILLLFLGINSIKYKYTIDHLTTLRVRVTVNSNYKLYFTSNLYFGLDIEITLLNYYKLLSLLPVKVLNAA